MTKAISIRLDAESERALSQLEASGMNQSEAIRTALVASAKNLQRRQEIAAEVAALEADESDRLEMLEVASIMESLRAQG
jgi:Arc/MetJ-type ribon-helix-helix transcriptional regulator